MRRVGVVVIAALAAMGMPLGTAEASEAHGQFRVDSAVAFSASTAANGTMAAFLVDDTSALESMQVAAPSATVCLFSRDVVQVVPPVGPGAEPRTSPERDCRDLSSLVLALDGDGRHDGWLGTYARQDVAFSLSGEHVRMAPQDAGEFKSHEAGGTPDREVPEQTFYWRQLLRPHLRIEGSGGITLQGSALLKVMGPDVDLVAAQASGRYWTGIEETASGGGVATFKQQWLTIEAPFLTLAMETLGPYQLGAERAVDLSWDGTVEMAPASGFLAAPGVTYLPHAGQKDIVRGRFSGVLEPQPSGASFLFRGILDSTSLAPEAASAALPASLVVPWVGGAVLGASVLAGGLLVARRRQGVEKLLVASPRPSADDRERQAAPPDKGRSAADFVRLAREELGDGRHPEEWTEGQMEKALEWAHAGFSAYPGNVDLRALLAELYEVRASLAFEEGPPAEGYEKAMQWLRRGLAVLPGHVDLSVVLSHMLRDLSRPGEAVEVLAEASRRAPPDSGLAEMWIATIYMADPLRSLDQALIHVERALQREPTLGGEFRTDPTFKELRGRFEFEEALAEAARRAEAAKFRRT